MAHGKHIGARIPTALLLATAVPACLLDPRTSGELADDGGAGGDGSGGAATTGDGAEGMVDPDDGSAGTTGEGSTVEVRRWMKSFDDSAPCALAIDDDGRIAVSWVHGASDALPDGRGGIDVYAPDGTLLAQHAVDGEAYHGIAFASDGTLRVVGTDPAPLSYGEEWARAFDADFATTWTVSLGKDNTPQYCSETLGVRVDADDRVYVLDSGYLRAYAADGALRWETDALPNGRVPFAVAGDGSTFDVNDVYGAPNDASIRFTLRKHTADGVEAWRVTSDGVPFELWASADGGAHVELWSGSLVVDADGNVVSSTASEDRLVIGPSVDGHDRFALGTTPPTHLHTDLLRVGEAGVEWSIPVHDGGPVVVSALRDDRQFVFAGDVIGSEPVRWLTFIEVE